MDLGDHFFRRESGRIIAGLIKVFGVQNLDLAEDVTQDAFCRAIEVWKLRGVPTNPEAWLMATAKNRALDILRRERTSRKFSKEFGHLLQSEWTMASTLGELFEPDAIKNDQLRVMFSCCDRRLPVEAQVALILNIVCGFNANEIANAYVSSLAAIQKRIARSKQILASSKQLFDVTDKTDFATKLPTVHRALYLLFNEGYHGSSTELAVRAELCEEAIWLCTMLRDHPYGATSVTQALCSLLCLNAARLPGRVSTTGDLTPLFDQDRTLWDQRLIAEGSRLLGLSSTGTVISEYHVEAMIAFYHADARTFKDTNWRAIVELYDTLMTLRSSPIIALNRAIAIAQRDGPRQGIKEINSIDGLERLLSYPFYSATLGQFELELGNYDRARHHFSNALQIARNPAERRFLENRISSIPSADE